MGHRGLIGFVIDGQEKLAYSHWGSYPDGNGLVMLNFARKLMTEQGRFGRPSIDNTIVQQIRDLTVVDGSSRPTGPQQVRLSKYADSAVSSGELDEWYVLLRNTQGDPDAILQAGFIVDSAAFAIDSLFNEGSYLIDLDNEVLEAYEGFVQAPHNQGRFAHLDPRTGQDGSVEYYPIRLAGSWPLSALPSDEEFLKHLGD